MAGSGTTGTSERTHSLQELLSTDVEFEVARKQVWGQFPFVPPMGAISGPDAGQTVELRFQQYFSPNTDTIDEKADITPQRFEDNKVSVTINEYGNAVQTAKFAEIVTKGDLRAEAAEVIGENLVSSLDRKAGRQYYEGNDMVFRANARATRAALVAGDTLDNSTVGMPFVGRATAALRAAKVPGFSRDNNGLAQYMTVIHTALGQDLPFTNSFVAALQNREGRDTLFNGEMGEMAGLRISESEQGKVYPGAGDPTQSATTLSAAVSAGDTTITVASATGLGVGDIITIGTVEDGSTITSEEDTTVENVLVTGVNGSTLTITGLGYSDGDATVGGLRYDHDAGTSVVEAVLVAALPVFGPRSVMKAYASEVGPFGMSTVTGPYDVLGRFVNLGWYFVGGWNKARRLYSVRLEVATKFPHIAINE